MLDPALLGVIIVVSTIPDFSYLPPEPRLQGHDGVSLFADMENSTCNLPAQVIEAVHCGHGISFLKSAKDLREVTA